MQSFALLALLAASASAGSHHVHHKNLHEKRSDPATYKPLAHVTGSPDNGTCGCTTYTTTYYGVPTLVQDKPKPTTHSTTSKSTSTWIAPTTTSTSSSSSSSTSSSSSSSSTPSSTSTSTTSESSTSSSSSWVAPSSTYVAPTSTYVAPTSTYVAPSSTYIAPTTSAETSSWAAPSLAALIPKLPSLQKSPASSGSGSGSAGSISPNGNQWAMTYTPYADDGSCKTADEVASDMATIAGKGFTTVRLYATDCSGPQNIGTACKAHGMKMLLGIFIDGSGIGSNTDEQIADLTQWGSGNWDLVEMVIAGNEAIFNGYASASELASFITEVKTKFAAAGYSGPVTTTEPLGTIQENGDAICAVVDVIAANIHPFFNSGIAPSGAGGFVSSSLSTLAGVCNNEKEAYNLETGWPSQGSANGMAIPGINDQKTAVESIMQHAGSKSAIFSFHNDAWKAPGALGVEQFWGCSGLFSG